MFIDVKVKLPSPWSTVNRYLNSAHFSKKKNMEKDEGSGTQTCVAIMRKRRVHNLMCVIGCVMRQTTHTLSLYQSLITVNRRATLSQVVTRRYKSSRNL